MPLGTAPSQSGEAINGGEGPLGEGGASEAPRELAGQSQRWGGWGCGVEGATFAPGGAESGWVPGTSAPRGAATQEPSRGPGAAAMDIPPLAGKIALLSLGALPLSFALNYISVLS